MIQYFSAIITCHAQIIFNFPSATSSQRGAVECFTANNMNIVPHAPFLQLFPSTINHILPFGRVVRHANCTDSDACCNQTRVAVKWLLCFSDSTTSRASRANLLVIVMWRRQPCSSTHNSKTRFHLPHFCFFCFAQKFDQFEAIAIINPCHFPFDRKYVHCVVCEAEGEEETNKNHKTNCEIQRIRKKACKMMERTKRRTSKVRLVGWLLKSNHPIRSI